MHAQLHTSLRPARLYNQIQPPFHTRLFQNLLRLLHIPLYHIRSLRPTLRHIRVRRRVSPRKFHPPLALVDGNDRSRPISTRDGHAQLPQWPTAKDGDILVCAQPGPTGALDGNGQRLDAAGFAP